MHELLSKQSAGDGIALKAPSGLVLSHAEQVSVTSVSKSESISGRPYLLKSFIELLATMQVKWYLVLVGWYLLLSSGALRGRMST